MTRSNLFVRIFALCVLACGVYAVAQDSPDVNITGGGTTNKIPRFTGAHAIGNSIMKQAGATIDVAGSVAATGTISATGAISSSSNVSAAGTISAGGVISGSSDVDAGGNVNVTGSVLAGGYDEPTDGVYSASGYGYFGDYVESPYVFGTTYVDTPTVYATDVDATNVYSSYNSTAGQGWFLNPGSGLGLAANNVDGSQVLQTQCRASSGYEYAAFNSGASNTFYLDCKGDFAAAGSKSAMVPLKSGKMVKVYSQESPQVWFEDFGSSNLMGGVATVQLESKYAQLANTKLPYHVVVTPNGDCKGLYVAQKNQNSFEVRELGGGQSSVAFDYRISALRNGYEKIRLEPAIMPKMQETQKKAPEHPAAHQPPAAPKR